MAETGEYSFKLKIDGKQLELDIAQAKKAFADLAAQAKKAGAVFDDIPNPFDGIGKSAPKVEAAKKQFDALGMSVSQLARETPALAMGVNTYIMAISNNLPVFADAVKKVREENAALAAQGKPTVSVLKQIGSALISWQTLLIAAVTTLAMNGDKVWAWVKGLFSAKDALDDVARAEKALHDVRRQGTIAAQEEVTKIRLTAKAMQDTTASYTERLNALQALKDEYPEYFAKLTTEEMLNGKAADSVQELIDKTIALAQARKAFNQIVENEENLRLLEQTQGYSKWAAANEAFEGVGRKYEIKQQVGGRASDYVWKDTREGRMYDQTQEQLLDNLEAMGEEGEQLVEIINDKYNGNVDAYIKAVIASNEKLKESATALVTDDRKNDSAAQRAAELRAKQITEASARLKADAERATSQAEVDAMKEGIQKEIAQINLNYDLKEQAITKREEELKKLRGGMLTKQEEDAIAAMRKANASERDRSIQAKYDAVFAEADAWLQENNSEVEEAGEALNKELTRRTKAWEDYFLKYGTIKERLLAVTTKYNRLINDAETEAERMSLEAERDTILAEYEVRASEWAQELVDKTAEQITTMASNLQNVLDSLQMDYDALDSSNSEDAKNLLAVINTLKAQIKVLKEQTGKASKAVSDDKWADATQVFQNISQAANDAAEGIAEFDEGAASVLRTMAQLAGTAINLIGAIQAVTTAAAAAAGTISAMEKASVILAVIGAAVQAVSVLINLFKGSNEVEQTMRQFEELNKEIERTRELARIDSWNGTIFGEDAFGNFTNNLKVMKDAMSDLAETQEEIINRGKEVWVYDYGSYGDRVYRGITEHQYANIEEAIANMQVKTRDRSGFAEFFGAQDEYANLGDLMPTLFGEDGKITLDALKELRDSDVWTKLSQANRDLIDEMISDWELYEEALDATNEYMRDIFGDLGASITDSLVDAFRNGTDAAIAMGDAVSDVVERIATDMAHAAFIQPLLEQAQEGIDALNKEKMEGTMSDEEYMRRLVEISTGLISDVAEQDEAFNAYLNTLKQIAGEKGYKIFGDDSDSQQTYAKGFQTMSQETGSELNGRFTDIQGQTHRIAEAVEFGRTMQLQQTQYLQSVSNTLASIHNDTSLIAEHTKALARMDANLDAMRRAIDDGAI